MKQEINTTEQGLELLTTSEACEMLEVKHNTFFRHYRNKLTPYKNAEKSDRRLYWDKKEVAEMFKNKKAKPIKVFIDA